MEFKLKPVISFVYMKQQNLIKISVQKFWTLLGTKKGSCHFNWKIHMCHQQLSALHVSAVKVFQVVKEMWETCWFLYGGSKSHLSTTLIHKRFLPEMCMNENPLTLWCCCFDVENSVSWESLRDSGRLGAEGMLSLKLCGVVALQLGSEGFSWLSSHLAQQEEGTMRALAGSSGLLRQQLQGTAADGAISPLKFVF